VLTADRFDNPLSDEVGPQFGQTPAAERQAQGRGWLTGQTPDGGDLPLGQAGRGPGWASSVQEVQALLGEITKIGIDGVDMDLEQLCNRGRRMASGVEQEHFGTTTLPRLKGLLQPSMDAAEFGCAGFPSIQGTRHG
jgi:hypothetical protein